MRRIAILRCCALLSLAFFCSSAVCAKEQNIFALRTAYLFYFSSLIEWPPNTPFSKHEFVLCVLGETEEDRFQLKTIDGKTTGHQSLKIRFIESTYEGGLNVCQMLYLKGESSSVSLQNSLPNTTLVVTEGEVEKKGQIHLFVQNSKLMFEIDTVSLRLREFKASSKLLRLSRKAEN